MPDVKIGSGNWGSVWLCKAKPESGSDAAGLARRTKLAVKLVHRAKTATASQTDEEKKAADAASKRVKTLYAFLAL
jgi:hypothetical protein